MWLWIYAFGPRQSFGPAGTANNGVRAPEPQAVRWPVPLGISLFHPNPHLKLIDPSDLSQSTCNDDAHSLLIAGYLEMEKCPPSIPSFVFRLRALIQRLPPNKHAQGRHSALACLGGLPMEHGP